MTSPITIEVDVLRSATAEGQPGGFQHFTVEGTDNMRVLDVIRAIYEHHAGDLAYQFACRIGRCGTCAVRVDGVPVLACQERCKTTMRIEPLSPFPVIRDLVVDRDEIETRYAALALTPEPTTADAPVRAVDAKDALALCHMDSCLACMVCVSGCPAVEERAFDGPAFMLKLRHQDRHPGNAQDRLGQALDGGLLECFGCDACTQLCPADLSPAQAIREFRRDLLVGRRAEPGRAR